MTRKEPISRGKMTQHGAGLGTVTREMVQKRARELAISDGRDEVTQRDFIQARRELIGAGTPAADEGEEVASAAGWDPSPGTIGHRAEAQEVDDEETVAERLMSEGIEEADHDERVESGRETRRQGRD